jgi:MarR family transcriptional regulator, organic hydroperoxide resistance regulator
MVDRLENTGLAERQPHPTDRRKRFVELTLDGEQATRAIYSDLGGQLHAIYAQLRPNQQDGVEKFLSQVSADLACPSLPAASTGPLSRG